MTKITDYIYNQPQIAQKNRPEKNLSPILKRLNRWMVSVKFQLNPTLKNTLKMINSTHSNSKSLITDYSKISCIQNLNTFEENDFYLLTHIANNADKEEENWKHQFNSQEKKINPPIINEKEYIRNIANNLRCKRKIQDIFLDANKKTLTKKHIERLNKISHKHEKTTEKIMKFEGKRD